MIDYPIAHIDLAALKHNFAQLRRLAPDSKTMAVIKANAYGHGIVEVAQTLTESDAFAVARLPEAIALRQAGIKQPLVVLEGISTIEQLHLAADNDVSLVLHHHTHIDLLEQTRLKIPLRFCWLMIETGMHRLGVGVSDVATLVQRLKANTNIRWPVGLMSHFANSDVINDRRNHQQLAQLIACAKQHNLQTSMANSAAILSYSESHGDWIRPGLMLYGASPFEKQSATDLGLKPVMRLTSVLIAIHTIQAGDQVGYGGDWTASSSTQIGIVSIGYGDGYSRHLSNKGLVVIKDVTVPIIGRVSMDMVAIDLSSISKVAVGDEVILWGSEQLSVDTLASLAGSISYELLSQLNGRVARDYDHGQS